MPQFYFHVRENIDLTRDIELTRDFEGQSLDDVHAAKSEAVEAAREIMAERVRWGQELKSQSFEIFDERGRHVLSFRFTDALVAA